MATKLNIPISELSTRKDKDQKSDWELLCFNVGVKILSGAGKFRATAQDIQKAFHCNYYKAKRLAEDAKSNKKLFRYDEKRNVLTAKRFEHRTECNRRNEEIEATYCVKIKVKRDLPVFSLQAISDLLRQRLMQNAFNATYRTNKFPLRASVEKDSYCSRKTELTLNKLANIVGRSRRQTIRMMKRMENDNVIKVERHPMKLVLACVNDETVKEIKRVKHIRPFFINGMGYSRSANVYFLNDAEIEQSFCHIIYSHTKRVKSKQSSSKEQGFYDREINQMFN
jgi:hypothetical protein